MWKHCLLYTSQRKVKSIKYSELKAFYLSLLVSGKLNICTVSSVHTILHATFKMLIRDEIIRVNPADDVLAEIKKSCLLYTSYVYKRQILLRPEERPFAPKLQQVIMMQ